MFDLYSEKCIIIDFLPGTAGHFISKLLHEVSHGLADLQPMLTGSYHNNVLISKTIPYWFNANVPNATTDDIKRNVQARMFLIESETAHESVEKHTDNIIRVHSYNNQRLLFEVFPNSKIISITIDTNREFLISNLFLITKYSIDFRPSQDRLGIIDTYNPYDPLNRKVVGTIKLGSDQVLLESTEEFRVKSNGASKNELLYLAYQLFNIYIPDVTTTDFYDGRPDGVEWSEDHVELKFDWILTENWAEIVKCFETILRESLSEAQIEFIKRELKKFSAAQNHQIIDDPLGFVAKLKQIHDKVEKHYALERLGKCLIGLRQVHQQYKLESVNTKNV